MTKLPAEAAAATEAAPAPKPSRRFVLLLAAGVLLLAGVGYLATGTPDYAERIARAEAQARAAAAPASMPSAEQLEAMVGKLVAHLKTKPEDAEGWLMLGRARALQGQLDEALTAYTRASGLRPQDARLLVDLAELQGLKNGRSLAGEPTTLLARALKIDPDHPKALALAGAAAFDAKDYTLAVQHWQRLVALSDPQAGYLEQLQQSLAEAQRLAQAPRGAADAAASPAAAKAASTPAANAAAAPAAAATLSGTVTLAPALAAQAAPTDTLFVFARPAQGPRMPLVILKRQVKDLPLAFTLDDSMAMSPAAKLSTAGAVVVVARISKSGQAMPQPGDLFGESSTQQPGSAGIRIVIDQAVK